MVTDVSKQLPKTKTHLFKSWAVLLPQNVSNLPLLRQKQQKSRKNLTKQTHDKIIIFRL